VIDKPSLKVQNKRMSNRLKFWRERTVISQAELARLTGVSRQALSAIESNKQDPTLNLALKIAKILNVPVERIFLQDPDMESKTVPTLSRVERLAFINQYKILQGIHKDDDYLVKYYQHLETIFERGYADLYHEAFDGLWQELNTAVAEEVVSILDLHSTMLWSLGQKPDPIDLERVKFFGFDANGTESEYLSYAKFITADGDKFSDIHVFNSHYTTLPRYRKMLAEWERMENRPKLSKAEIESILEAGTFKN